MATALLTYQETADRLRITVRTLYRIIDDGDLPPIKIRGSLRISVADLEAYLQRQRKGPGDDDAV